MITRELCSSEYDIEETTRFTIYMMEKGIAHMGEGCHKLCVVFNLEGITMKAVDYKFLKRLVYILAHYYPERLASCLIVNAPGFFSGKFSKRLQLFVSWRSSHF